MFLNIPHFQILKRQFTIYRVLTVVLKRVVIALVHSFIVLLYSVVHLWVTLAVQYSLYTCLSNTNTQDYREK